MARKPDKQPPRSKKYFRPTKSGAGMTKAGVARYRRENPGSKLKTAVTGKVKQLTYEGFVTKLRKNLRTSYQQIGDTMVAGGVKDMESYRYLLGQAHAYQLIDQEISNLLNPKEDKKHETERPENVVDFGKPKD
jgi:hypothetical protein